MSFLNRHRRVAKVLSVLLIAMCLVSSRFFAGPAGSLSDADWVCLTLVNIGVLVGVLGCFLSFFDEGLHPVTICVMLLFILASALSLFIPRTRFTSPPQKGGSSGYYALYGWPAPVVYQYLGQTEGTREQAKVMLWWNVSPGFERSFRPFGYFLNTLFTALSLLIIAGVCRQVFSPSRPPGLPTGPPWPSPPPDPVQGP